MSRPPSVTPVATRPGARLRIFLAWVAAYVLSYFFRSANAVIAGDLRLELGLDAEQLGLMTSVFFATFALVQLPLGGALDRWGPRFVVSGMLLVGAAGSLLFALAPSYALLMVARGLIGVGFAGVLMGGLKAFAAWFEPRHFASVSGLLVGIGSAGALLAGTPLAWLAQALGWRAVFALGAGFVLLAAAGIALGTRNAPSGAAPARRAAVASPAASFATVLRDGRFWRISFINLAVVGAVLAIQGLWAGPYLADVYGLAPLGVGNLLLVLGGGSVAGNLLSGWLADRLGRVKVVGLHAALAVAASGLLALAPPQLPTLALAAAYLGLGVAGSFVAVLFAHVRVIFPAALLGRAMTAVNFFGIGGAMLLQWLMGAIIEAGGGGGAGYGAAAYRPAFALTATLALVAALFYLPVAGDERRAE